MQCSRCGQANPEAAQFCTRCHAPLRYTCPACKHVQAHGGKCEKCGVDFAKYLGVLLAQSKLESDRRRERVERRSAFFKQILLLPITGGLSLIRYLFSRSRNG
jgi:methionyl-tRNA synthetase